MLPKIKQNIQDAQMLGAGQKVLVAVSGGPDSIFLAWALRELGFKIGIAHFNYQLRGEDSEKEEALVREYARDWSAPFFVERIPKPDFFEDKKESFQAMARQLRYDFFEKTMSQKGYKKCATAHHLNDQAESIMMALMRGKDTRVLRGIPPTNGPYIRPILNCYKSEILAELTKLKLGYSLDYTNYENKYFRNQVRNQLLPAMHQWHPKIEKQLAERLDWYEKQTSFLGEIMEPFFQKHSYSLQKDTFSLNWLPFVSAYSKKHLEVFVAFCLKKWGLHGHEIWQALQMLSSTRGKKLVLGEQEITRTRDGFKLSPVEKTPPIDPIVMDEEYLQDNGYTSIAFRFAMVKLELQTDFPENINPKNGYYLDMAKLQFPLTFRGWKKADRMQPLGMQGSKMLSDIFIDQKWEQAHKETALLVEDVSGEIICLLNFRISEKVKISKQSKQILYIEIGF